MSSSPGTSHAVDDVPRAPRGRTRTAPASGHLTRQVLQAFESRARADTRDVGAVEFGPYAKLDHGTVGPKPFPHYNGQRIVVNSISLS
ncbi:hypothetical protein MTO96_004921 [Rhipicephalus appendiculatus]